MRTISGPMSRKFCPLARDNAPKTKMLKTKFVRSIPTARPTKYHLVAVRHIPVSSK